MAKKQMLQQNISVTGFDTAIFLKELEVIDKINVWLDRHFQAGALARWVDKHDGGTVSLDIGNRIFTPSRLTAVEDRAAFSPDVDPYGSLAKLAGDEFVHAADNEVNYYRLFCNQPYVLNFSFADMLIIGSYPVAPTLYRCGDVVQVNLTVNIFPTKTSARMGFVLRSVTLMESRFTMVSICYLGDPSC